MCESVDSLPCGTVDLSNVVWTREGVYGPIPGINGPSLEELSIDRATAQLRSQLADMEKRAETAEAIVAQLPKTADGVPAVPFKPLWTRPKGCRNVHKMEYWVTSDTVAFNWDGEDIDLPTPVSKCYSTKEAALVALKRKF